MIKMKEKQKIEKIKRSNCMRRVSGCKKIYICIEFLLQWVGGVFNGGVTFIRKTNKNL